MNAFDTCTTRRTLTALLLALSGAACEVADPAQPETVDLAQQRAQAPASDGHAVGTRRIVVPAREGRQLTVQLWYPAVEAARAEAEAGHPASAFEPEGPLRERLARLLATGRPACTNLTMHAAIDAAPAALDAPRPLIVASHHMGGSRVSTFTINERLAQLGFVVAGIDHTGGTMFELAPGDLIAAAGAVTPAFLRTRVGDLSSVIDVLLDGTAPVVPEGLRGQIDPLRIGAYGHSMGGFAVGGLQVGDPRVKAAAFLAIVPTGSLVSLIMQTPPLARFRVPALYLLAQEDATVAALGGAAAVREAFSKQKPPAWLVEVKDLGHFAFADDLDVQGTSDGCGSAARATAPRERFTNVAPAIAREIATRYTSAFFAHQLLGAPAEPLSEALPAPLVITDSHP